MSVVNLNLCLKPHLWALAGRFLQDIAQAEQKCAIEPRTITGTEGRTEVVQLKPAVFTGSPHTVTGAVLPTPYLQEIADAVQLQQAPPPPPPEERTLPPIQIGAPIAWKAPDAPPPPPNDAYDRLQDRADATDESGEVTGDINGVDREGLGYDKRIHSSSQKFLAKTGCWKLARNVDKNLVASVRAELIAKRDAKTPPPPAAVAAPATPPPPPAAAVVTPPAGPTPQWTFGEFCQKMVLAGKTFDVVSEVCRKYGLKDQTQLAVNPALIPVIAHDLGLTE
jgi:hypothetical protein